MHEDDDIISEDTLSALLKESAPQLRNYVEARFPVRLGAFASVDDIIQDVWIAAFRARPHLQLKGQDALKRWLTTLARRKLMNKITEFRRLKRGGAAILRQHFRESAALDILTMVASTNRTPSSEAAVSESAKVIRVALANLPEDQRQAIHLRFIEGHPPEIVAQIMNKPLTAVRGIIFRGLRKLHSELGEATRFWSDIPTERDAETAQTT
jgi:RNA polymerase sigma factor (sigma-70 family)